MNKISIQNNSALSPRRVSRVAVVDRALSRLSLCCLHALSVHTCRTLPRSSKKPIAARPVSPSLQLSLSLITVRKKPNTTNPPQRRPPPPPPPPAGGLRQPHCQSSSFVMSTPGKPSNLTYSLSLGSHELTTPIYGTSILRPPCSPTRQYARRRPPHAPYKSKSLRRFERGPRTVKPLLQYRRPPRDPRAHLDLHKLVSLVGRYARPRSSSRNPPRPALA